MTVEEAMTIMTKRLMMAHTALQQRFKECCEYRRRYQRPLPYIRKEGTYRRGEITDKVIVAVGEVLQEGRISYSDQVLKTWKRYYDEAKTDGVVICIIGFLHNWGTSYGVRGFMQGCGLDAQTMEDMAPKVSGMCEPALVELIIKLMDEVTAELTAWLQAMDEEAAGRIEQHKELIEQWAAELAVDELTKPTR